MLAVLGPPAPWDFALLKAPGLPRKRPRARETQCQCRQPPVGSGIETQGTRCTPHVHVRQEANPPPSPHPPPRWSCHGPAPASDHHTSITHVAAHVMWRALQGPDGCMAAAPRGRCRGHAPLNGVRCTCGLGVSNGTVIVRTSSHPNQPPIPTGNSDKLTHSLYQYNISTEAPKGAQRPFCTWLLGTRQGRK